MCRGKWEFVYRKIKEEEQKPLPTTVNFITYARVNAINFRYKENRSIKQAKW